MRQHVKFSYGISIEKLARVKRSSHIAPTSVTKKKKVDNLDTRISTNRQLSTTSSSKTPKSSSNRPAPTTTTTTMPLTSPSPVPVPGLQLCSQGQWRPRNLLSHRRPYPKHLLFRGLKFRRRSFFPSLKAFRLSMKFQPTPWCQYYNTFLFLVPATSQGTGPWQAFDTPCNVFVNGKLFRRSSMYWEKNLRLPYRAPFRG